MSPKVPPASATSKRLTKRAYVDLLRTASAVCRPSSVD
jgi:hypothetical protein